MGLTHHGDKIWNSPNNAPLEYQNNLNILSPKWGGIFCKILSDPYKSPIFDKAYLQRHTWKKRLLQDINTFLAYKYFLFSI